VDIILRGGAIKTSRHSVLGQESPAIVEGKKLSANGKKSVGSFRKPSARD
jgi:hypothetical protein